MAFKGDFSFEIVDDFDKTIDEKGNSFIALRKIKWGDSEEVKLDLRKYAVNATGERMMKGVSFLTEEGPNELTKVLIQEGFGDTTEIITAVSDRDDFRKALNTVLKEGDEFYDPNEVGEELFSPGENLFDYDDEETK